MSKTVYEWVWEECDEYDDILDVDHYDELKAAPQHEIRIGTGVAGFDLTLQKNVYNSIDGDLEVKAYAYVDPLTLMLDEEFELAGTPQGKVPKRFHKELESWFNK